MARNQEQEALDSKTPEEGQFPGVFTITRSAPHDDYDRGLGGPLSTLWQGTPVT